MAPPPWAAGTLAVVLLVIAGYCAARLVAARWWRRSTDRAVDVMHATMGVAMAGMLVPRLNPIQARAWAALFAAGAVWFAWQAHRDRRRRHAGSHALPGGPPDNGTQAGRLVPGGHHGAHVLSCAAMVCMLVAAPHLGAPMTAGHGAVPVVALVLAVAVAISVVVSTDRIPALPPATVPVPPVPGPAGTAPAPGSPFPPGSPPPGSPPGGSLALGAQAPMSAPAGSLPVEAATAAGEVRAGAAPVLCPRLAATCQILMGVAMAYMLILML